MRGIRGATVIPEDGTRAAAAVRELLYALVQANDIRVEDLAAALFSLPPEMSEVRAAAAAREMGWDRVPLFELAQPVRAGDPPRCLRVLLLWNTTRGVQEIRHVYLGEAARLRPDLAEAEGGAMQ
ncbi:MAG: chorismate mutase [Bacillota bacterium]|nr:chorismate mutase [Bacillota bacterium]